MSPTIFRDGPFRFYFFSREESRMHVHSTQGEAKFWMEPRIELAQNWGLPQTALTRALTLVKEHEDEIRTAWTGHFGTSG